MGRVGGSGSGRTGVRAPAGGQQLSMQPQQFGTEGVVMLFDPVAEDLPAVLGQGIGDDCIQKSVQLGHGSHLRGVAWTQHTVAWVLQTSPIFW